MPNHWDRDPSTGDYLMTNNAPTETDSLRLPMFLRIKCPRQRPAQSGGNRIGWMYAPDKKFGSDLNLVKKRNNSLTDPIMESMGVAALQPLIDDGRATDSQVTVVASQRGGVYLQFVCLDSQAQPQQLLFNKIGV